jgi:hypothetical protein
MKITPIRFLTLILCALAASHALAQDTKLKPGAIKGETLSYTKARNYAFCEIYVGFGSVAPSTETQGYNSTGTTGPDSGCPAETFATLDPKKVAAQLGASFVFLNPVKQTARKWWVMDELYLYAAGETFDFSGVKATWVVEMSVKDLEAAGKASQTPYQVLTNTQFSKWVFKKGNTVFLLRAPEGKVYAMQAYATIEDPSLTYEQLPQLGSKLKKLPPGWKYEVKTLDKDLVFDVRKATPPGLKHLTLDEFANVYLGCGFDAACNYAP